MYHSPKGGNLGVVGKGLLLQEGPTSAAVKAQKKKAVNKMIVPVVIAALVIFIAIATKGEQ